jgi:hypothetical protein
MMSTKKSHTLYLIAQGIGRRFPNILIIIPVCISIFKRKRYPMRADILPM